jgi:hypothetical protein
MRLNWWQRIGIIASICWFVIGGFWINVAVIEGLGASVHADLIRCIDSHSIQLDGTVPKDTDLGPCDRKFLADIRVATADHWYYAAAFTLIPILLVWLFVYGLVGLVRRIKASFTPTAPR